jgi:hypothetical protein
VEDLGIFAGNAARAREPTMIERLFLASPWIAVALNVIAYVLHYSLSIYETRLYHAGASGIVTYEGRYETPPAKMIGTQRPISWRLIWVTLTLGASTVIMWWVALQQLQRPEALAFIMGGWLLMLGMFIIRDLHQITLFRYWRSAGGSKGQLTLSDRLYIVTGSTDYQVYAAFFLFLLLVTGDFFFLGGAFTCFAVGRRRRDWGILQEEKYPRALTNV